MTPRYTECYSLRLPAGYILEVKATPECDIISGAIRFNQHTFAQLVRDEFKADKWDLANTVPVHPLPTDVARAAATKFGFITGGSVFYTKNPDDAL